MKNINQIETVNKNYVKMNKLYNFIFINVLLSVILITALTIVTHNLVFIPLLIITFLINTKYSHKLTNAKQQFNNMHKIYNK